MSRAEVRRAHANAAAIILAAGESRRMGRPKALLPFRAGTFISVLAETLGRHCSPVYAVFGFEAKQLMEAAPASVIAVENPDYQMGMLTSLQAGLRAMTQLPERVLFTLVDHPSLEDDTVCRLLYPDAALVVPRYAGRRGHPVVMRRDIVHEFLAEPPTSKLSDVMNRIAQDRPDQIHYIDVEDPGVRDDIDDPRLYQNLLAREAGRV